MGFNLFGSSKGDSSTTNDYRQDNSVSIQEGDLSEGAIRADGDVTVTDGGAFDLVETTSKESLKLAGDLGSQAFDLSRDQTNSALDFGRDALGFASDNAADTFNAISENNRRTYDLIERATNDGALVADTVNTSTRNMLLALVAAVGLFAWSRR